MATNDVPGANPSNGDVLRAGAWAEHADGSLIYVKGTENNQVIYELYDMAITPPVSYTDAMLVDDFKRQFSVPPVGKSKDKWTWHDKTPFDWKRVMSKLSRPVPGFATADDLRSAAQRVADSLNLRGKAVAEESVKHNNDETLRKGYAIVDKLYRAMQELAR